jgi:aspartate carbamoyltransferase regulatory subunit
VRELKVQPIRNGTVIDHIAPGMALKVLHVLRIPQAGMTSTVTAAINVPSKAMGRKDIVKVEDRELDPHEVDKISLIAPRASINIIREYEVAEKHDVRLPDLVEGIVRCPNPNCITNQEEPQPEPVLSAFKVTHHDPPRLQCGYCDRVVTDVAEHVL